MSLITLSGGSGTSVSIEVCDPLSTSTTRSCVVSLAVFYCMPAPGTIRTSNSQCSFVTSKLGGRELGSVMMMMHWHVDDGITADALLSWTQTDWNGDGRSVLWVGGRALGGLAKALRPEVSQGVDEDGPRDPRAVHRLPLDVCAPFSPVLIASQAEALSILKSALLSSALFDLCPPLCICEHVHRDILACYLYQVPPLSGEYQDLRLQVRPFDVSCLRLT